MEGVFGVGDTLACGRVVVVDLEDVGTTSQKSVEVGGGEDARMRFVELGVRKEQVTA